MPDQTADLERRLRLAHQSRRASEHQLDGIRRALCDAGFMQDDDPYGHTDLADVIRQVGQAAAEKAAAPPRPIRDCGKGHVHDAHDWLDDACGGVYGCIGHPVRKASPARCGINHDCPGQPRPEPLTARNEARCQSQHRPEGGALVQCGLMVHPGVDTHTDYCPGQTPPPGRNPERPWHTWRDEGEAADGPTVAGGAGGESVVILYVNHRGQRGYRPILPQRLWFGTTEWHRELQWFLDATDLDRGVVRSFALRGILAFDVRPGPLA